MDSYTLRKAIGREEFDYQALMNALKKYRAPRQKINELLKSKKIIRIKKGLYVFNPEVSNGTYNKLHLANTIYGPSYISFETALSFYRLIPERVEVVTSVTCKKNKEYKTPVGTFTYKYLNINKYPLGVLQQVIETNTKVFMASPEKVLIDYISLNLKDGKGSVFNLFSDLRIDEEELMKIINLNRLRKISKQYTNPRVTELFYHLNGKGQVHG